jgi:hypothetical protein
MTARAADGEQFLTVGLVVATARGRPREQKDDRGRDGEREADDQHCVAPADVRHLSR